jgi:hypothetical protein
MKTAIAAVLLILGLTHFQTVKEKNDGRLVLPNSNLLRCESSDCFQLWPQKPEAHAIFPKQLVIDMNQNCIYGLTALYDKSVPVDDIKSAIDARYARWANHDFVNSPLKLWRVESEKFAIQLSVADRKDEKRNVAEAGTKLVTYISFGEKTACNTR